MTGRDLIIYILANNLENESVIENDKILGFMSIDEAAVKFCVGPATIKLWVDLNIIPGFKIGDKLYIPANTDVFARS